MSWTTVRAAIQTAVAQCLGVSTASPGGAVEWVDRAYATRYLDTEVWADLRLSPITRTHHGETRYVYDEDEEVLVEHRVGWSHFSVTVIVQTESQEPGEAAVDVAGQIHLRMQHSSILAGLQAAQVSIREIGPVIDATYTDSEGRAAAQAAVELQLSTVESWTPTTPVGDYFERVLGEGETGGDLEGVDFDVSTP